MVANVNNNNIRLIPLGEGGYNSQIDGIVSYHKPCLWTSHLILNLSNGFVYGFSCFSSILNYWTTLHLIYSSYRDFYRSSCHMTKPHKVKFYHNFHNRCYSNSLYKVFIPNHILSNVSNHPTQNSHRHNTELILFTTQHSMPYNILGLIIVQLKLSFEFEWHFLSQITPESLLH